MMHIYSPFIKEKCNVNVCKCFSNIQNNERKYILAYKERKMVMKKSLLENVLSIELTCNAIIEIFGLQCIINNSFYYI